MTTSRQTLSRRGTRRNAGVPFLGISSDYKAYGTRIDWTDAKIVKITITKDCTLPVTEVAILRSQLHEGRTFDYQVEAGTVIYFARSSHGNFYYLLRWNGHQFCCSCVAGQHNTACHHQEDVNIFLVKQQERKEAGEPASDAPRVEYAIEMDFGFWAQPMYRVNGGAWQFFLGADGTPVVIEGEANGWRWLQIVQESSQAEADLWYEALCAAHLEHMAA